MEEDRGCGRGSELWAREGGKTVPEGVWKTSSSSPCWRTALPIGRRSHAGVPRPDRGWQHFEWDPDSPRRHQRHAELAVAGGDEAATVPENSALLDAGLSGWTPWSEWEAACACEACWRAFENSLGPVGRRGARGRPADASLPRRAGRSRSCPLCRKGGEGRPSWAVRGVGRCPGDRGPHRGAGRAVRKEKGSWWKGEEVEEDECRRTEERDRKSVV